MKAGLALIAMIPALFLGHARIVCAATGYQDIDTPAPHVKLPQRIAMVALARAGKRLVAAGVHGVIITSDDGGKIWRQSTVPVDVTLTSIYFQTPAEGWSAGHYGVVLHTVDGGYNWTLALTGLDVIKAMQGVAANMQEMAPDTAATALQTKVATVFQKGGPDQPFLTVNACGHGILVAGAKDMAMFTADDGKTWRDWTPNIINPHFRMIYDSIEQDGKPLLIGEAGLVAFGDPACTKFSALPSTTMPTLFGGLSLGPAQFLVYGLNGAVFTTGDDGVTWRAVNIPSEEVITTGIIFSPGKLLLGTLSGHIYVSENNAATFERMAASVPFQISALENSANGTVIVAGNGGVVVLPVDSFH